MKKENGDVCSSLKLPLALESEDWQPFGALFGSLVNLQETNKAVRCFQFERDMKKVNVCEPSALIGGVGTKRQCGSGRQPRQNSSIGTITIIGSVESVTLREGERVCGISKKYVWFIVVKHLDFVKNESKCLTTINCVSPLVLVEKLANVYLPT